MRKYWFWPIVLVGVISYLYLNFAPPPENKSTHLASATTSPKIKKLASTYSPSQLKEPRVPVTSLDNIQPATASYPSKQSSPIPATSANKPLPKIFWGYLRLVDTTFFGHNHPLNRAIIEDLVTSEKEPYPLSSTLPYGSKLTQILKDRIVLEKNGKKRSLRLFDSLDNAAERKALLARGYQRVTQNKWLISSNRLLKDNKNIAGILAEAEITPYSSPDGERGFQVNKLKQGSLMEELGFREGDIISGVNGGKLGDIKAVLQTYRKLRKSSLINVTIEREQHPANLSYQMIPDGTPSYSIEEVLQASNIAKLWE